jgi:NTE family protein
MTEDKIESKIENKIEDKIEYTYITEICLSGACNRGISYLGCFKKMEELGIFKPKKMVGVSIGSFIAACYIIGYSTEELLDLIIEKDMKKFCDISFSEQGSVLKGAEYKKWVYEVISKKENPNITLKELYSKTKIDYVVTATCIHSTNPSFEEGIIYFSHINTPDIPLYVAVTCSMAFPFIFPPVHHNGCQFIDGGVLDNFPMDLVSTDAIGLRVNFKAIEGSTSTRNPVSYIGKLFELITNRFKYLKSEQHKNIISIECDDFNLIDFEMPIDDIITLYKRGYKAMETYLELKNMTK